MADNPNDIPRGMKVFQVFWPAGLAAMTLLLAGARADARIDAVEQKATYLYANGAPPIAARLARIEERQLVLIESVNKLNDKLDKGDFKNGR